MSVFERFLVNYKLSNATDDLKHTVIDRKWLWSMQSGHGFKIFALCRYRAYRILYWPHAKLSAYILQINSFVVTAASATSIIRIRRCHLPKTSVTGLRIMAVVSTICH